MAALTHPQIGAVTTVNETNLAYLGSLDAIAAEKARLVQSLPAAHQGGVAILNHDDARVRAMSRRTSARVITFGRDPDADLGAWIRIR